MYSMVIVARFKRHTSSKVYGRVARRHGDA